MFLRVIILSLLFLFSAQAGLCAQSTGGTVIDLSKPLTEEMLEGKTLQELWLLRSEIFARHGKGFKTYELHAYFMGKGLAPNRDYSDEMLTEVDLKNIALVQKKEKEFIGNNYETGRDGAKTVRLGNVLNGFQYGDLPETEKDMLGRNGFVVTPARHEQLFYVYEKNSYLGVPSFITTDSVLQVYSIFFDTTLRLIEERYLTKSLRTLIISMKKHAENIYEEAEDGLMKDSARSTLAYFSVPYYFLLDYEKGIHEDVRDMVMEEVRLAEKHEMIAPPPILKSNKPDYENPEKKFYWPDYSQFVPRGHYTRSEDLKRYFKVMLWLGLYPLHIEKGFDHEIVQSLITTKILYEGQKNDKPLLELWKDIYEPTVFYVGLTDDIGPDDVKKVMDEVYGKDAEISDFADLDKLEKTRHLIEEIFKKKTRIKHVFDVMLQGLEEQGPRFMLMGQRYIPDSEVMQRLVGEASKEMWSKLREMGRPVLREYPKGLDVMAVFGSRLARELMLTKYKNEWEYIFDYPGRLEKLTDQFDALTEEEWKQNLYYSWIWSLKALIELNDKHKYQFFMDNEAWEAKNLNTSLASWAELRHHTILYGKQSFFGAECGGDSKDLWVWLPEPPKGYVEPNLEFYNRLIELLEKSGNGLKKRGLLDPSTEGLFEKFRGMVSFLADITRKEVAGEPRTIEEYERIRLFGAEIGDLTYDILIHGLGRGRGRLMEWHLIPEQDRNVPVIADVHTAYVLGVQTVLEEGVGYGNEIYVIVEDGGALRLMRGAVLSYYEFPWPAKDRLTDEKWLEMLKQRAEPELPEWTGMFMSEKPVPDLTPVYVPEQWDFPRWSTQPGWRFLQYEGGC